MNHDSPLREMYAAGKRYDRSWPARKVRLKRLARWVWNTIGDRVTGFGGGVLVGFGLGYVWWQPTGLWIK